MIIFGNGTNQTTGTWVTNEGWTTHYTNTASAETFTESDKAIIIIDPNMVDPFSLKWFKKDKPFEQFKEKIQHYRKQFMRLKTFKNLRFK